MVKKANDLQQLFQWEDDKKKIVFILCMRYVYYMCHPRSEFISLCTKWNKKNGEERTFLL